MELLKVNRADMPYSFINFKTSCGFSSPLPIRPPPQRQPSGARIIVTLIHEMLKRPEAKKGLATLCIGGGMGTAVVVEKV